MSLSLVVLPCSPENPIQILRRRRIVKVDFIIRKDTEYRRLEFERRQSIAFEGLEIDVTSPEDLVISKLYWAKDSLSEMQLRDVGNLLSTEPLAKVTIVSP